MRKTAAVAALVCGFSLASGCGPALDKQAGELINRESSAVLRELQSGADRDALRKAVEKARLNVEKDPDLAGYWNSEEGKKLKEKFQERLGDLGCALGKEESDRKNWFPECLRNLPLGGGLTGLGQASECVAKAGCGAKP